MGGGAGKMLNMTSNYGRFRSKRGERTFDTSARGTALGPDDYANPTRKALTIHDRLAN